MNSFSALRGFVAALAGLMGPQVDADVLAAACGPGVFIQADQYAAGSAPTATAAGDFNNDGVLDVVASGASVAVLPGHGDGTFGPPILSPVSWGAKAIAVGLFNGDANLDIAIANAEFGGPIVVLLGNGDGTFQPGIDYSTSYSATGMAAGDINGDGVVDLVETAEFTYGSSLFVLLGNGNGSFQPAVEYPSLSVGWSAAAADFNGDGRADVAVPYDNSVGIFFGDADGSLSTPTFIPLGLGAREILATDVDNDGHVDLAISRDTFVDVLFGEGDGTFLSPVEYPIGLPPLAIAAADADGDGRTDIAVLQLTGVGVVTVLFQTANRAFGSPAGYQARFPAGSFVAGDFNSDDRADFAATVTASDAIAILLSGPEAPRSPQAIATEIEPAALAQGDFDLDGLADLAVIGRLGEGLLILGRERPSLWTVRGTTALPGAFLTSLAAADLNADGRLDVAAAGFNSEVLVLLGNGDSTFQTPASYPSPTGEARVVAGDFNGDGHADLAVTAGGSDTGALSILLGSGDGTFQPAIPGPALLQPVSSLITTDLDGDGRLDLVTTNGACCGAGSDSVAVLLGNGDGTFRPPMDYATGYVPSSVVSGDFDGDGHPDLLVANSGSSNVSLLVGDGQGGFAPHLLIGIGWSPRWLTSGDFNGDGKLDAATANGGGSNGSNDSITVLFGRGDGTFETPVRYSTGASPVFVMAGDFGGGDAVDLAMANQQGGTVSIFFNSQLTASVGDVSVETGSSAVIEASVSGFGPLSYQWRKNGVPLSDGGTVSGATTATLTIDSVAFTDAGNYDIVVTDSCTTVTSNSAALAVEFADVPVSSPYHDDIIKIATAGITAGCGGGNYCPDLDVTRAQVAVFLLTASQGSGYAPPPAIGIFGDVPPGSFAANFIEDLYTRNISGGCNLNPLLYCPDSSVTRAQMAVFLLTASQPPGYTPPPAIGIFGDVAPGSFAADWIEDLYNRNISGGCNLNPLLYCPGSAATRATMATLLVQTFSLP